MKILFVSHDANRAGAQLFLLSTMKYLKQKKGIEIQLLLLSGGVLENEFAQTCPSYLWPNANMQQKIIKKALSKLVKKQNKIDATQQLLETLKNLNFDYIYVNTIASAHVLQKLTAFIHAPLFAHIHELEFSIQLYSQKNDRDFLFKYATKIIACSKAVAENIIDNHGVSAQKIEVIHSFIDNESILSRIETTDNQLIKQKYNLPEIGFLIGGCGNAEWRKGIDVFLQVINQVLNTSNENCHFVWIGVKKEGDYYEQVSYDIAKMEIGDKITFIEQTPDAVELINCLDIFTIVSREDPFPLVMLEAALAQKTMIGFDKTGGCSEFIEDDAGIIVPYLNTFAMASSITKLFLNQSFAKQLGQKAKDKVLKKYSFENSILKIEDLLKPV